MGDSEKLYAKATLLLRLKNVRFNKALLFTIYQLCRISLLAQFCTSLLSMKMI